MYFTLANLLPERSSVVDIDLCDFLLNPCVDNEVSQSLQVVVKVVILFMCSYYYTLVLQHNAHRADSTLDVLILGMSFPFGLQLLLQHHVLQHQSSVMIVNTHAHIT